MLLSTQIKLVLAFDHRHVFIDPAPDVAKSYAERQRLFNLPRSSWDDYDKGLISEGGGVFPRSAKSIPLSAQARAILGTDAKAMAPNELINAILKAPVDLLYNGGIGTYVKASFESHAQAGDKAGDAFRVNGNELRCKVFGEGGNLGCHAKRAHRVCPDRRPDLHRCHRQLGRRGLLRPRGEHQDSGRRGAGEWGAHAGRAQRVAGQHDR